jgi:hypothetical protein
MTAATLLVLGCNAVFGIDELGPAPGAGESGGASAVASAAASGGSSGGGIPGGGAGAGVPTTPVGCADGEREGYLDVVSFPDIAACAGGFQVPGSVTLESMMPACNRQAGDDGGIPDGEGCSIEDLCAEGWRVCGSPMEVASHASACPPEMPASGGAFWLTRMTYAYDSLTCPSLEGTNNIAGCGYGLEKLHRIACAPLNRGLNFDTCAAAPPWSCNDYMAEATVVTKAGSDRGGVLCCRHPTD